MSNSSLVSYVKISPHKNTPRKSKIDTITIHCTAGRCSVETLGKIFSRSRGVSANYGIGEDGRVGMYVEEKDRSWCSSNRANDHRAITIECSSDSEAPHAINDKVYATLIELCADICRRNDIKELKWKGDKSLIGQVDKQNMTVHKWFYNKECPGKYIYERLGKIADEVNALLGIEPKEETPVITPEVTEPVKTEDPPHYGIKSFVKDVQAACGAKVDGIPGPETLSKTVTISATCNRRHPVVKAVQKRLYTIGYTEVGDADGIAGPKFTAALKRFQKENKCPIIDGEATEGKTTWRKLLWM